MRTCLYTSATSYVLPKNLKKNPTDSSAQLYWYSISNGIFTAGDAGRWTEQRVWLCLLFLSRGGHQSCDRDERAHRGLQAPLCGPGTEEGGEEGPSHQPVHAAHRWHEGLACQHHHQPVPACCWRVFHACCAPGELLWWVFFNLC